MTHLAFLMLLLILVRSTVNLQSSISHVTDSLSESYQRLKVLVMAYGGISPDSSGSSRAATQLTTSTSTSSKMITLRSFSVQYCIL